MESWDDNQRSSEVERSTFEATIGSKLAKREAKVKELKHKVQLLTNGVGKVDNLQKQSTARTAKLASAEVVFLAKGICFEGEDSKIWRVAC